MKIEYKELTKKFANHLMESSTEFFEQKIKSDKKYSILNIIDATLSAHLTACFETMRKFSKCNEEISKSVDLFISCFEKVLSENSLINKVEFEETKE